jgi:hypothetical protein
VGSRRWEAKAQVQQERALASSAGSDDISAVHEQRALEGAHTSDGTRTAGTTVHGRKREHEARNDNMPLTVFPIAGSLCSSWAYYEASFFLLECCKLGASVWHQ